MLNFLLETSVDGVLVAFLVALFAIPTVTSLVYFVPFTVTVHDFNAEESILPSLPEINCRFQATVVVLFATD